MGSTVAFFNGVRLWKNAKSLRAEPGAQVGRVGGLGKRHGRIKVRSPNALYDVSVFTSIPPVTEISTTVGRQATHHLEVLQTQARLVAQSRSHGYISWVVDESHKLDVSGSVAGGANKTVAYAGSGFVPAAGDYVLFRNPTTGDGFVTQVESIPGAGQILVDLQSRDLDRNLASVDITAGWDILLTAYHFPYAGFERMVWREVPSQGEDKHSMDVQYTFASETDAVYATAYVRDLT